MPVLPTLNGRELLRALLKGGFYIHHQRGGHARLFHETRSELKVTVPVHNKSLPEKTLKSILKQADLKEKDLLRLLK